MPVSYQLKYLPEGRTEVFFGSRGNYYRLEDGSQIDLHSRPVWCSHCKKVTHGERIESIKEIEKEIDHLERLAKEIRIEMTRPPTPDPKAPGDRIVQEQIAELRLRRQWRLQRQSPPKCIQCGSTDIIQLERHKPVSTGTGVVVLDVRGLCSTSFNEWFFTIEGERILER